jgi:hypothetical protein
LLSKITAAKLLVGQSQQLGNGCRYAAKRKRDLGHIIAKPPQFGSVLVSNASVALATQIKLDRNTHAPAVMDIRQSFLLSATLAIERVLDRFQNRSLTRAVAPLNNRYAVVEVDIRFDELSKAAKLNPPQKHSPPPL